MMNLEKHLVMLLCISGLISGCETSAYVENDVDVKAVVIGVENGWAGKCTGSLKDIKTMTRMLLDAGVSDITILDDKNATYSNVTNAFMKAVDSELMVLYYSGHGGSKASSALTLPYEVDSNDEFLCLYDTIMLDDDIWDIIKHAKGRVFLIFDCCHSETMFRKPMLMSFSEYSTHELLRSNSTVSIICWSGCPDDSVSYGSADGGKLTNCIKKHFNPMITYDSIWSCIERDKTLKYYQESRQTKCGIDFGNSIIFR